MAKFAKSSTQAASVIRDLQKLSAVQRSEHAQMALPSLGTARNFGECLKHVCEWMKAEKLGSLRELTKEQAIRYLDIRSEEVGQKALDQERQAMQKMMQSLTGKLAPDEKLPVTKSEHAQILEARAYTREQMLAVAAHQSAHNALATEIAYASGLRAHEFLTLRPLPERAPDERPADPRKFSGRPEGVLYTVQGKGGLVRVVSIPSPLAQRLEALRLTAPRIVTDRTIHYKSAYAIGGGKAWTNSFSRASSAALGFSNGAHGLRHSYAQDRMLELRDAGINRVDALRIVSQEMGHFRPEITETYLR